MSKRLDREFARFDVDLLDSDEYLSMPAGIRNHAYLYLLALTGRSRKRRTDGRLSRAVADDMAKRMGRPAQAMLDALQAVGMVALEGDVLLTKYSKWQETAAEIEKAKQDARDRQARHRAQTKDDVTSQSQNGVTRDSRVSHATEKEEEGEKEREYASSVGSFEGDAALAELATGMHELLGRQLSSIDIIACKAALNQFAYLDIHDLIDRAREHQEYCRDHQLPEKRTVEGFSDTWRRENDHRADMGQPKRDRRSSTAHVNGTMQRLNLNANVNVRPPAPQHTSAPIPPTEAQTA